MRKIMIIVSGVVLLIAVAFYLYNRSDSNNEIKDTLQEIKSHYVNSETGMIHAYPEDMNSQYLSESVGLYMEYLVKAKQKDLFAHYIDDFQDQFIVKTDKDIFIRWELDEKAQVNALIDDLRIAAALQAAAKSFKKPAYDKLSKEIIEGIKHKQMTDGLTVDYYDWKADKPASRITLSYLTRDYFENFKDKTREQELLKAADKGNGNFFPEYYDVTKKQFIEQEEVHMVDQLLIATNRAHLNIKSPQFLKWLKDKWQQDHKIYGRYSRTSGTSTVPYESLSVYYYMQQYCEAVGEGDMAAQVQKRMNKLGGHGDEKGQHFFDYLHYRLMLLQNRK